MVLNEEEREEGENRGERKRGETGNERGDRQEEGRIKIIGE